MELTRLQKVLLLTLVGMLVVFSILMAVFRARPGLLFRGSLLKITESDGQTVYSGQVHDTEATVTVTHPAGSHSVVTFSIPGVDTGAYEVFYPLEPVQTEYGGTVDGIRILRDGAVFCEGGYDWERGCWFGGDGAFLPRLSAQFYLEDDPWGTNEITAASVLRFLRGDDTVARGDPFLFAAAVFISILTAADIVFYRELFRWRHWAARDPEPSDGYLVLAKAGWVLLTVVVAALYLGAMAEIC